MRKQAYVQSVGSLFVCYDELLRNSYPPYRVLCLSVLNVVANSSRPPTNWTVLTAETGQRILRENATHDHPFCPCDLDFNWTFARRPSCVPKMVVRFVFRTLFFAVKRFPSMGIPVKHYFYLASMYFGLLSQKDDGWNLVLYAYV